MDLDALAHNVGEVRRRIPATCEIIAIVKANAYGHGAIPVARALVRSGVQRLGVATIPEGIALRTAGVEAPILVLGAMLDSQLREVLVNRLTPMVGDRELVRALAQCVRPGSPPYPIHLKVDTGMGRLGFRPEEVPSVLKAPEFRGALRAEGVLTHLADADGDDPAYTMAQLDRFRNVVQAFTSAGARIPLIHAANSAGVLAYPAAHFTAVRPGLMLYGYHMLPDRHAAPELRPILTLRSRVAAIRELAAGECVSYHRTFIAARHSRIAVLPIGYADGYSRHLSNRAQVLIGGRRAPVVGLVCMDLTMVDVTEVPGVRPGDEVILIGSQGTGSISAQDVAAWANTIPYEVLCGLGPRIVREYVGGMPHSGLRTED